MYALVKKRKTTMNRPLVYSCDVTLYFNGQPGVTKFIDRAKDKDHAISLAKLDAQARGWDLKKLVEVHTSGGRFD